MSDIRMWRVTGVAFKEEDGWTLTRGMPTFYIPSAEHGITKGNEGHALEVARDLLDTVNDDWDFYLYVTEVEL